MNEEIKNRIREFHNRLSELQDERREIEHLLEDEYGVDIYDNAGYIEDENIWCYGFDIDKIEKVIKESKV